MFRILVAATWLVLALAPTARAQDANPGLLQLGEVVATGFSGTIAPDPLTLPDDIEIIDETLIDFDGISARVLSLAAPGYIWDGSAFAAPEARIFRARDIGQVFGVTLGRCGIPQYLFHGDLRLWPADCGARCRQ